MIFRRLASRSNLSAGISRLKLGSVRPPIRPYSSSGIGPNSWSKVLISSLDLIDKARDAIPFDHQVVLPLGSVILLASFKYLPMYLNYFHETKLGGRPVLLPNVKEGTIPFEKSFWRCFVAPARVLVAMTPLFAVNVLIAPDAFISQHIEPIKSVLYSAAFLGFLYKWKSVAFHHILSRQLVSLEKESYEALSRYCSAALLLWGLAVVERHAGVTIQTLFIGRFGGAVTAIAGKDILANVLCGYWLQLTKAFSSGDIIKCGSIEGRVVQLGLTRTLVINAEKFKVTIPNIILSSEALINKSQVCRQLMETKIPIRVEDLGLVSKISMDISSMLSKNPNILLGDESPYCFLSQIQSSHLEITVGCIMKEMKIVDFYSEEERILLEALKILTENGACIAGSS